MQWRTTACTHKGVYNFLFGLLDMKTENIQWLCISKLSYIAQWLSNVSDKAELYSDLFRPHNKLITLRGQYSLAYCQPTIAILNIGQLNNIVNKSLQ